MIIETKNCIYLGYERLSLLDKMQERVEVAAAKRKKAAERKTKENE